ncbi:MAG: flagellar basal body rod protein FlgC [Candidatus Melainabacteria bacterium]|nr:flagellar basal body rod protein FlgC [Candidatus Melainabacteria bacterium]MBI3309627.1 flagellar basal body rod protein FlgC [Candidatus Melainabacteria bacterium]
MTFFDLLNTAANGLEAQRARMNIVSENIANAHTPGYKRKMAVFGQKTADPFSVVMARELGVKESQLSNFLSGNTPAQGIHIAKVLEDKTPGTKVYMPGHPTADKDGYVEMSNVDSLQEMVEMMYATRNYKANLSIVEMAKSAARETLNIGKPGG